MTTTLQEIITDFKKIRQNMITVEFVLGIIFLAMSVTGLIFCTTMAFASWNANWLWAWFPFTIFIAIGGVLVSETPTEGDVLNGKAHYVEVYHTYGNDTIKTYHLNWDKRPIEGGSHQ